MMSKRGALSKAFAPIPIAVLMNKDLSNGAKMTYGVILSLIYDQNDDCCSPGYETIARRSGVHVNSTMAYLDELELAGYIRRDARQARRPICIHLMEIPTLSEETPQPTTKKSNPQPPIAKSQKTIPQTPIGTLNNSKIDLLNNTSFAETAVPSDEISKVVEPILSRSRYPGRKQKPDLFVEDLSFRDKGKDTKDWNCNDMIGHLRDLWNGVFQTIPFPPVTMQHRTLFKRWIEKSGAQEVKETIEFAVVNWQTLQQRYKLTTALPDAQILYGYRSPFSIDRKQRLITPQDAPMKAKTGESLDEYYARMDKESAARYHQAGPDVGWGGALKE